MIGTLASLGAAFCWTYACFLWREQTKFFSPIQINSIKNIIAVLIFSPILLTIDLLSNYKDVYILLLSGVIGIAIGDSFYITALKKLGTRRTLSIEAFSPLMANILGSILINETLSLKENIGILIVTFSLLGIAAQRTILIGTQTSQKVDNNGFYFAFFSIICAVFAATLSRIVFVKSELNPFQTSEIRLLGAVIALGLFTRFDLVKLFKKSPKGINLRFFYATLLGTNLGILLQQIVFQTLPVGLGWTLLSTSPVISLFFARAEGEILNWKIISMTLTIFLGLAITFI